MIKHGSTIAVIFVLLVRSAFAYEIETHGVVTEKAYHKVRSSDVELLSRLGVVSYEYDAGLIYYDVSGSAVYERGADRFEQKIIEKRLSSLRVESSSIAGWLLRGAIREDDGAAALFLSNPQDDPYGNINRFLNHFFDPVNNAPLSIGGQNHTAPAWALGTTNANAFSAENSAETGRRNHYSVKDAREYMFRALTEMSAEGSKAIGAGGATPSSPADKEALRKAYWATTFRALGDIVHLVQDMGQPQHTRNDPHSPINVVNGEHIYERFTNQRALNGKFTCFFGLGGVDDLPPLEDVYDTYPTVNGFSQYGDFFSTGVGSATGVAGGKGLADYSNRGFYTAGTNVGMSRNTYSSPTTAGLQTEALGKVSPCFPPGSEAVAFKGTVHDTLNPGESADNVPLTVRGLWEQGESDPQVRYSLNEQNYIAMANLLIPRAVAYSAGLIDYFFRGRMEISLPDDGVYAILDHAVEKDVGDGFRKIKFKLYNSTPAINDGQNQYPQAMTGGTLRAVVKFQRNGCYQPDLSGEPGLTSCNIDENRGPEEIVVSEALTIQALGTLPAQAQEFEFDFSTTPIPVNAVNVSLQAVYRGVLGSEADAVVVATHDISEPTFVAIMNNTDYHMVDGIYYRPDEIRNNPSLMARVSGEGYLEPIDKVCSFNFGGKRIGNADIPPSTFVRFGVLADYPQLLAYVYSHTWNYWTTLNIGVNKHQYDPQVGMYQVQPIPPGIRRGVRRHKLLIYLKWSGTYNEASAVNLDGLDDLEELVPRSIVIDY